MANMEKTTQQNLNIADIRDEVIILHNGELRSVLEVTALNFALKSEQEQAAIVYQYQAFLNSLQFPVQILVQSRRLDLTTYLTSLQQKMTETTSTLLRNQIADYVDFVGRLISLGNIMEKHFYVVIPYASPGIRGRNVISQLFTHEQVVIEEKALAAAKAKLAERAEEVRSGLSSMGLSVGQLTGEQLVKLLYATYNPAEVTPAT